MPTRKEYLLSLDRPFEEGESVELLNKHRAEVGFFEDDYRYDVRQSSDTAFADLYANASEEDRKLLNQRLSDEDINKMRSQAYIRNRYTGGQALSDEGYDAVIREIGSMDDDIEIDYSAFNKNQKDQLDMYNNYTSFTVGEWGTAALTAFAKFAEAGVETLVTEGMTELSQPSPAGATMGGMHFARPVPSFERDRKEQERLAEMRLNVRDFFKFTNDDMDKALNKLQFKASDEDQAWFMRSLYQTTANAPYLLTGRLNPVLGFVSMYGAVREELYDDLLKTLGNELGTNKANAEAEIIAREAANMYASIGTAIEYAGSAAEGRLAGIGTFAGKQAKRMFTRAALKQLTAMGIDVGLSIGEEVSQQYISNVFKNMAIKKYNAQTGSSIPLVDLTEGLDQAVEGALQLQTILVPFGLAKRGINSAQYTKYQQTELKKFGFSPKEAKYYSLRMLNASGNKKEFAELTREIADRKGEIDAVKGVIESDLTRTEMNAESGLVTVNGEVLTDADFNRLAISKNDKELAAMVSDDNAQSFIDAVRGGRKERKKYNDLINFESLKTRKPQQEVVEDAEKAPEGTEKAPETPSETETEVEPTPTPPVTEEAAEAQMEAETVTEPAKEETIESLQKRQDELNEQRKKIEDKQSDEARAIEFEIQQVATRKKILQYEATLNDPNASASDKSWAIDQLKGLYQQRRKLKNKKVELDSKEYFENNLEYYEAVDNIDPKKPFVKQAEYAREELAEIEAAEEATVEETPTPEPEPEIELDAVDQQRIDDIESGRLDDKIHELAQREGVSYEDKKAEIIQKIRSKYQSQQEQEQDSVSILERQILNARISLQKIMPIVKFVTHDTSADFNQATGGEGRGFYDIETKTIHINRELASATTVPHEVFHAIFHVTIGNDKNVQYASNQILNSIRQVAPRSLQKRIDAFKDQYQGDEAQYQSEEALAELMGIMSAGYGFLKPKKKTVVQRFLDRVFEPFGIRVDNDSKAVYMMNTLARKITRGENITQDDLSLLDVFERESNFVGPETRAAYDYENAENKNGRFQARYIDEEANLLFEYIQDEAQFFDLQEQGYITVNEKSISDYNGRKALVLTPDNAFTGNIYLGQDGDEDQILIEGSGGVGFVIKFHDDGSIWAGTKGAMASMKTAAGKAIEDGKLTILLKTGSNDRLFSSITMANGIVEFLNSLVDNPNFNITQADYDTAVKPAISIIGSPDTSIASIRTANGESTFEKRKAFIKKIIRQEGGLADIAVSNPKLRKQLEAFINRLPTDDYEYLVTGKTETTRFKDRLYYAFSSMLTDPVLKNDGGRDYDGQVYAAIEVNVSSVDELANVEVKEHESYPVSMRSNTGAKAHLHLLKDRAHWTSVILDPYKGGNFVEPTKELSDRYKNAQIEAEKKKGSKLKPKELKALTDELARVYGSTKKKIISEQSGMGVVTIDTNGLDSDVKKPGRRQKVATKESDVENVPPAENAQKTQVATTTPTYVKSEAILNTIAPGKTLDYGAGRGKGSEAINATSYEPFPIDSFDPDYTDSSDIANESFEKIISPSVLNVVPKDVRDNIVLDIGRILKQEGAAIITARSVNDVKKAKFKKEHSSEPNAFVVGQTASEATFQKGFTQQELSSYAKDLLGEGFEVTAIPKIEGKPAPSGIGILIKKKKGRFQKAIPNMASSFSGIRTVEAALEMDFEDAGAVEFDPEIVKVSNVANGTDFEPTNILDVDPNDLVGVKHYHTSPPCTQYSPGNPNKQPGKLEMDIARKIADIIRIAKPETLTIENAPDYSRSKEFEVIKKELNKQGYEFRINIVNARDYGGSSNRLRMILQATREGTLPEMPKETGVIGDWYKVTKEFIKGAPEDVAFMKGFSSELANIFYGIETGRLDPELPIMAAGGNKGSQMNAGSPAPALTTNLQKKNGVAATRKDGSMIGSKNITRVLMPVKQMVNDFGMKETAKRMGVSVESVMYAYNTHGFVVKRATSRMMARIMDLPDTFKVPAEPQVARAVLGNGVNGVVTKKFIEPMLALNTKEQKKPKGRRQVSENDFDFLFEEEVQGTEPEAFTQDDFNEYVDPDSVEENEKQDGIYTLTLDEIKRIMKVYRLGELDVQQAISFATSLANAKKAMNVNTAHHLALQVANEPRPLTDTEHATFVLRAAQIQNRLDEIDASINTSIDGDASTDLNVERELLLGELNTILRADAVAGSETGRALSARRMVLDKSYNVAAVVQRMVRSKKDELSSDELDKGTKLAKENERLARQIEELERASGEERERDSKTEAKKVHARHVGQSGTAKAKKIVAKKEDIVAFLKDPNKKNVRSGGQSSGRQQKPSITLEVADAIYQYAKIRAFEGETSLDKIVEEVINLQPSVTIQDVYGAISGRIQRKTTNKSDEQKRFERLKLQADLEVQIDNALDNIFDPKREQEPTPTEISVLREKLAKLKEAVIKNERQNIQLEKIVTRIEEIDRMIDGRFREVRKVPEEQSQELRQALDDLLVKQKELRAQDRILLLETILKYGEPPKIAGTQRGNTSEQLDAFRGRIFELKKLIKEKEAPRKKAEAQKRKEELLDLRIKELTDEVMNWQRTLYNRRVNEPTERSLKIKELNTLKKQQDRIAELQDILRTGIVPEKAQRIVKDPMGYLETINDLRTQIRNEEWYKHQQQVKREAIQVERLKAKIAEQERRLATFDFEDMLNPPEKREILNPELEKLYLAKHINEKEIRRVVNSLKPKDWWQKTSEYLALPRAFMATADMSYVLRQGLLVSVAHPKLATKAFVEAFKSTLGTGSEQYATKLDFQLRSGSNALRRESAGLFLSSLDDVMSGREESFNSALIDRIHKNPALKPVSAVMRASERNMVIGLNMLRAGLFDDFVKQHPNATDAELKVYAHYINTATGRGDLKAFEGASQALSGLFFSPRFAWSRVAVAPEALSIAAKAMAKGENVDVAKEVGRQWFALLGTGAAVLMLAQLAGAEVEEDPEESDFGKIQIGRVRLDIYGGMGPQIRFMGRLIKAGIEREDGSINIPNEFYTTFLKYKVSPWISGGLELYTGRDYITSQDISPMTVGYELITPITFQGIINGISEEHTIQEMTTAGVSEFFGMGSYVKDTKKKRKNRARNFY